MDNQTVEHNLKSFLRNQSIKGKTIQIIIIIIRENKEISVDR